MLIEKLANDWRDAFSVKLVYTDAEENALAEQAKANQPEVIRAAWQYYIEDLELHSRGTPGIAQFLKHMNRYLQRVGAEQKRDKERRRAASQPTRSGPSEDDIHYANIGELKATAAGFPNETVRSALDAFGAPANYYTACDLAPPEEKGNRKTVACYPLCIEAGLESSRDTGEMRVDSGMFGLFNIWQIVMKRGWWRIVEGDGAYCKLSAGGPAPLPIPSAPKQLVDIPDEVDYFDPGKEEFF